MQPLVFFYLRWACGGDFVTYRKKHVLGQVFFFFLVQLSFLRSLVICDFNDTIVYTWYEGVLLQKAWLMLF